MSLTSIAEIVAKSAPLLASVIGGPVGALASTALSLVANLFSANPKDPDDVISKINADPDSAIKLKQLEIEHEEFLIKSKNDHITEEFKDRESARELEEKYLDKTGHQNWMLPFLVIMLFVGMGAGIYCIIKYNIVGETIAFMMGTFCQELKSVYAMYFGDSGDNDNVSKR